MRVLSQTWVWTRALLSASVGLSMTAGLAWASPISVVRMGETFAPINPQRILFQDRDVMVVREPTAEDRDFQNLFVVNLANHFSMPADVEEMGEVLDFVPRRFAVMHLEASDAEALAARLHAEGMACGLLTKLNGDEINFSTSGKAVPRIPVVYRDDRAQALIAKIAPSGIKQTIDQLAAIPTRFHRTPSGETVADLLSERYRALAAGRQDIAITTYDHKTETPQRSLIVRIEGRTKPEEVIVLGSHLDSVNWSDGSDQRAPGADDNASGTATNLEVFRVMMEAGLRPERSIEIHAYAAEEIGLVGSQDIAQAYRRAGRQVVAMVQHDMTLYKKPGTVDKIWLVSNNTDDTLNNQLGVLIDTYVGMAWAKRPLYAGSSDHASWKRAGYPAAFPFENPSDHNPHIHTANDTTERANAFDQAAGFGKLGMAFALHFGGIAD